nr:nuclear transport factor 2 family protein [uncultured Rhodoferax sp.]
MTDHFDHAFFRQLELRRTRALVERDMVTIDALHAPEYELITPSGKVFDRALYRAAIESGPFYTAWEVGEMACRVSPSMAIVRYKARLAFPSGRELTCWHTDTYEKRVGQWQAVWSQATQLPETKPSA